MTPEILDSPDSLAAAVAEWIVLTVSDTPGPVALSLSGGSTPKRLYTLLATEAFRTRLPWARMHLFFGDERFVPPGDEKSNLRMVAEAMLAHVPIPPGNVHAVPTEHTTPDAAADAYAAAMARFYGSTTLDPGRPLFALTLLGLGTNGHTASLFPDEAVLNETARWAAPVSPPGEPTRITMTYPALNSSAQVAFLVTGADKKEMLARLAAGDTSIPAGRIRPTGAMHIFADRAAAG